MPVIGLYRNLQLILLFPDGMIASQCLLAVHVMGLSYTTRHRGHLTGDRAPRMDDLLSWLLEVSSGNR